MPRPNWIAAVLIAADSIGTASAGDVQVNSYTTGDQRHPSLFDAPHLRRRRPKTPRNGPDR